MPSSYMPFASPNVRAVAELRSELRGRRYETELLGDGVALDLVQWGWQHLGIDADSCSVDEQRSCVALVADRVVAQRLIPRISREHIYG